jgi:hypothetical protein
MKVRSLSESTDRYVKGCIRAFLEGSKDFGWIVSIVGSSADGLACVERALASLGIYGDAVRRGEILQYIASCHVRDPLNS